MAATSLTSFSHSGGSIRIRVFSSAVSGRFSFGSVFALAGFAAERGGGVSAGSLPAITCLTWAKWTSYRHTVQRETGGGVRRLRRLSGQTMFCGGAYVEDARPTARSTKRKSQEAAEHLRPEGIWGPQSLAHVGRCAVKGLLILAGANPARLTCRSNRKHLERFKEVNELD